MSSRALCPGSSHPRASEQVARWIPVPSTGVTAGARRTRSGQEQGGNVRESYNRRRAPELSSWSIPQWFLARCAATPDGVAFRYKDQGLYQEVTWQAYRDTAEAFLAGLEALGLQRGERVAAMSDPCR